MFTEAEKQVLRSLAGRVREIAELDEMPARRQRWRNHNALRPERPLVLIFPEGCWRELITDDEMECVDPLARKFEWWLRSKVYWWDHLHDDAAIEPWFPVPWSAGHDGWGVPIVEHRTEGRGSAVWDPPIKNLDEDISRLKFRDWHVRRAQTQNELEIAHQTFGDLLVPRIRGRLTWSMGMTADLIRLVGLEQLMMLMIDDPDGTHRIMAWMRDEQANYLDWLLREQLLCADNEDDYVGSGGLGYTDELPRPDRDPDAPLELIDLWGFAESQETVGISPDMFIEFILPYQVPLLNRFGLACYGCCEPVHDRLPALMEALPRLRRVSASPWVDEQKTRDLIGDRIIFSRKPNPTQICAMFDEDQIRADLRKTLQVAGQGPLEIIMKDTHTLQHERWRATRWVELALEEVDRYMQAAAVV